MRLKRILAAVDGSEGRRLAAVLGLALCLCPTARADDELPMVIRDDLDPYMEKHGDQMTVLMASAIFLNYEVAKRVADDLGKEPLRWPLGKEAPKAFHQYQRRLTQNAKALSAAAAEQNATRLAKAFGDMTATCMACHARYLYEKEDPAGGTSLPDEEGAAAGRTPFLR